MITTFGKANTVFFSRLTGEYGLIYVTMFLGSTVFPLLLLFKRIGKNPLYIVAISIGMMLGWIFSNYTILMFRDNGNDWFIFLWEKCWSVILGFILVSIAISTETFFKKISEEDI